jgi:hypothetical protein
VLGPWQFSGGLQKSATHVAAALSVNLASL